MWDEHHKDVLVMWAENHAIAFMLSIIIVTWTVWYGILVTAGYAMSYDLCPARSATMNTLFLTVEIVLLQHRKPHLIRRTRPAVHAAIAWWGWGACAQPWRSGCCPLRPP